jgi:predicted esterase YcpF (UPF0227 family)
MNILYIHGWGSSYDPDSDKVEALRKLGDVYGVNLDYTEGYEAVLARAVGHVVMHDIHLVVGTSMGGYMASHVGKMMKIPYVACNPALRPAPQLRKYLGDGETYDGRPYHFTDEARRSYPVFAGIKLKERFQAIFGGNGITGLILLDRGDEVIDANETLTYTRCINPTFMFEGGSHRFEHMQEAVRYIEQLTPLKEAA